MNINDIIKMAKEAGIESVFDLGENDFLLRFSRGSIERFAALVSAAASQRKPLTESFLEELAEKHVTNCYFDTLTYARAIERAHGIGGEE